MGRSVSVVLAAAGVVLVLCGCSKEVAQKAGGSAGTTTPQAVAEADQNRGEALFRQLCSSCHPDGGNVTDPERSLHGSALRRNRLNSRDDIVRVMRNPISRMIRFDEKAVSDKDALVIADYILKTFR